jgi:hypothetical protein
MPDLFFKTLPLKTSRLLAETSVVVEVGLI